MTKEITLRMPAEVRARVDRLQELSGASSLEEVLRWSLAVYDTLLTARQAGKTTMLRDASGDLQEVVLGPKEGQS